MQHQHTNDPAGITRRAALWWLLIAAATFTVYLFTLRLSPTLWHDEVMQLEWGRLALPGADASYGLGWLPEGRPFRAVAYLGCAVQEFFCRLFDTDPAGHRIGSILGACLASFALLGWLLARGTVPWIAIACAVLLLWEPTFVQGYRGGRVDSYSIAFMLLALWAVVRGRSAAMPQWRVAGDEWREEVGSKARGAGREGSEGDFDKGNFDILKDSLPATSHSLRAPARRALGWFALAGVCVGISGLMWVSAILLVPLLLHELWATEARGTGREARDATKSRWRVAASRTLIVVFGAVAAVAILLLPDWGNLPTMLSDFLLKSPTNAATVDLSARLLRVVGQWGQSPWLPLAALACLFWPPRWSQLVVLVVALVMMLFSGAYIHRGIYLLPYFLLAIATASSALWSAARRNGNKVMRVAIAITFAFLLAWSGAISLGARTVVAWQQREGRDPQAVMELAMREIGEGPHNVYLGEYEFYFAGRKMKWRNFRSFGWENWQDPEFLRLVSTMNYVIYRPDNPLGPEEDVMDRLGFSKRRVTAAKTTPRELAGGRFMSAVQFGDYDVYAKEDGGTGREKRETK